MSIKIKGGIFYLTAENADPKPATEWRNTWLLVVFRVACRTQARESSGSKAGWRLNYFWPLGARNLPQVSTSHQLCQIILDWEGIHRFDTSVEEANLVAAKTAFMQPSVVSHTFDFNQLHSGLAATYWWRRVSDWPLTYGWIKLLLKWDCVSWAKAAFTPSFFMSQKTKLFFSAPEKKAYPFKNDGKYPRAWILDSIVKSTALQVSTEFLLVRKPKVLCWDVEWQKHSRKKKYFEGQNHLTKELRRHFSFVFQLESYLDRLLSK